MDGIDAFQRQIKKLQNIVANLGGQYSITEVLDPAFMRARTSFGTFEEMCAAAGIHTAEQFTAMPDDVWERHVRATTSFQSWETMQQAAGEAFVARRLRQGL